MKKIVYMLSAVIVVVLGYISIPYVFFSSQEATAIGIIGGADGPTAVFVATKLNPSINIWFLLGVIIVISGIIFLKKR